MDTVRRLAALGVLVVLTACSDTSAPTGEGSSSSAATTAPSVQCLEPPQSEVELASSLTMTLDPNPVEAGAIATLSVSSDEPPYRYLDGAGATWQCWDGIAWVDTHQIVRGFVSQPTTLELTPGATITIPAIGLPVPNSYPILIPMVPPGTYRIIDQVGGEGRKRLGGHVIVVVR